METTNKQINFKIKKRENKCIDISGNINEISLINQLYLKNNFNEQNILSSEINKKINGYKTQDKKKDRLDASFITFDETVEKLVTSKLKCYYCKESVVLMYKDVRQDNQWTLERIDNNICHSYDNVVISCLKCNLKRRCIDSNRFKFSKQVINIKKSLF